MDQIYVDDQLLATVTPEIHEMIRIGKFDQLGEHRFASTNEASELITRDLWQRAGVAVDGRVLLWRAVPARPAIGA